jgi:ABC-type uncharacterized transport system YnjBCD substrate-binding protein
MKRTWSVRREFQESPDAQQRWERAFQYLLEWAPVVREDDTSTALAADSKQEISDENSGLSTGFDVASSSSSIH